uniref:Lysosomal-associated membrane protein 2 n=1 Tax=Poecilia formosa TaxID=48698 RepID=A0A096MEU3_POEFO
ICMQKLYGKSFSLVLCYQLVLSHGIEVEVKNDDKLCLYANLTVSFSVTYEIADNKNKTVSFELPANASSKGSQCNDTNSILKLSFLDGHSWSVNFSLKDKNYQADTMTFVYNLNDSKVFPDSSSNETVTVTTKPDITDVGVNTSYSCKSKDTLVASLQANMTLSDVLIQAFIVGGNRSKNLTTCPADTPVTPTPTHVTNATTVAPVTNATTVAPVTNVGNYSIRHDANSTACLLANFGLRIGFTQNKAIKFLFSLNELTTNFSLSCETFSEIREKTRICSAKTKYQVFLVKTKQEDTKKFRLHAVNVTINSSSGVFAQSSANLSLWEAAVGSSYMCNKEQNFTITSLLSFYTFSLHVQPFGVKNGLYSTAHECSLDDPSILIPIIVGAALAGLILIVVIAYVIGRRKTHAGYQTL